MSKFRNGYKFYFLLLVRRKEHLRKTNMLSFFGDSLLRVVILKLPATEKTRSTDVGVKHDTM